MEGVLGINCWISVHRWPWFRAYLFDLLTYSFLKILNWAENATITLSFVHFWWFLLDKCASFWPLKNNTFKFHKRSSRPSLMALVFGWVGYALWLCTSNYWFYSMPFIEIKIVKQSLRSFYLSLYVFNFFIVLEVTEFLFKIISTVIDEAYSFFNSKLFLYLAFLSFLNINLFLVQLVKSWSFNNRFHFFYSSFHLFNILFCHLVNVFEHFNFDFGPSFVVGELSG